MKRRYVDVAVIEEGLRTTGVMHRNSEVKFNSWCL